MMNEYACCGGESSDSSDDDSSDDDDEAEAEAALPAVAGGRGATVSAPASGVQGATPA